VKTTGGRAARPPVVEERRIEDPPSEDQWKTSERAANLPWCAGVHGRPCGEEPVRRR
jgi:hypothetical protein